MELLFFEKWGTEERWDDQNNKWYDYEGYIAQQSWENPRVMEVYEDLDIFAIFTNVANPNRVTISASLEDLNNGEYAINFTAIENRDKIPSGGLQITLKAVNEDGYEREFNATIFQNNSVCVQTFSRAMGTSQKIYITGVKNSSLTVTSTGYKDLLGIFSIK